MNTNGHCYSFCQHPKATVKYLIFLENIYLLKPSNMLVNTDMRIEGFRTTVNGPMSNIIPSFCHGSYDKASSFHCKC